MDNLKFVQRVVRRSLQVGIGHDKIHSEFFSTPPQSVTFVIRLPALRTADVAVLTNDIFCFTKSR